MKKNFLILFALTCIAFYTNAQDQDVETETKIEEVVFTVYGNCGMCEKTIEGSLQDVKGVRVADWDRDTDQMTVSYNPSIIQLDEIKQNIADVGYDSDSHRAKDEIYNSLPGCCQYDRPEH